MQYREFEQALVRLFSIDEFNLSAFRARLRHLRNLGIPDIPKRGSGNTATYKLKDLFTTFVALALQSLGSAPSVSAMIAIGVKRYAYQVGSEKVDLFLVITNMPDPTPENIEDFGETPGIVPGFLSVSYIKNPVSGTTVARVIAGAAGAGLAVTEVKSVASSVINLSYHFRNLSKDA